MEEKIITIPEKNFAPRIIIVGKSRIGMSLFAHRMADRLYHQYGNKVCWLTGSGVSRLPMPRKIPEPQFLPTLKGLGILEVSI